MSNCYLKTYSGKKFWIISLQKRRREMTSLDLMENVKYALNRTCERRVNLKENTKKKVTYTYLAQELTFANEGLPTHGYRPVCCT